MELERLTTYHIFSVLLIKDIINEDGDPTTPHKLATGTKPSMSHLRVLFCPGVVRKATAHVETKTLNMRHQAQKGFRGIFVGIPEHQKGYLVYLPSTRKVISSYNVVFDESFFKCVVKHVKRELTLSFTLSLEERVQVHRQFVLSETSHTGYTSLPDASTLLLNRV